MPDKDDRVEYTVDINGIEHTMLLDEQSARRLYGDKATKSGGKGKSSASSTEDVGSKALTSPANKARTGSTK
jgi:hypothetical protein